jgi:mono/diheme cytochrome c family protein
MKKIVLASITVTLAIAIGSTAFIYSGVYNVAASEPHWAPTRWVLEEVRTQSIKARAKGIAPPEDLGDQARIVAGTSHFSEHCALCHSAPGVAADGQAEGMYPKPPVLTDAAKRYSPGELFWILKNGLKMTGMPSWGDHGDEELWNAVAFLEKLPGLKPDDYASLVAAAKAAGGHHAHGDHETDMPGDEMPKADSKPDHAHNE